MKRRATKSKAEVVRAEVREDDRDNDCTVKR